jgi:hypothetical protein
MKGGQQMMMTEKGMSGCGQLILSSSGRPYGSIKAGQ